MKLDLQYRMTNLENGIKVAHRHLDIPDLAFIMRVNEGSIHEPENQKGILHLMEHLFFRSSTGEDLNQQLFKITGRNIQHAFTRQEETVFWFRMPTEDLDDFLKLWANAVKNITYNEACFETERKVVLNEIAPLEQEGTLPHYFTTLVRERLFPGSPLGFLSAGKTEHVKRFSRQEVGQYKRERINAANTILTVVGGYDQKQLQTQLERHFGSLRPGEKRDLLLKEIPEIDPIEERKELDNIAYTQLLIFFQAPGDADKDILSMRVLKEYLGGGTSSRLFKVIREEKGLAYSINIENILEKQMASSMNKNLFFIAVERFDEEKYDDIKQLIEEELERVRQEDIDYELLDMLKIGFLKTFYEKHLQNCSAQAVNIDAIVGKNLPYTIQDEIEVWRAIQPKDLASIAKKVFNDKYATLLVTPKG